MTLFYAEWEIMGSCIDDCTTYFSSMDEAADKKDAGPNCELIGRWSNLGSSTGCCISRCKTSEDLSKWFFNWNTMAKIKTYPILDDNQAREIILGEKPSFTVPYLNVGDEPKEGESLYVVKYKFQDGKRMEGHKAFAGMTEEQDKADSGNNRVLGRYHNLGNGSGICICGSTSEMDLYKWAFNWAGMCDISITPVVTDKQARKIGRSAPGYQQKLDALMKKMGMA